MGVADLLSDLSVAHCTRQMPQVIMLDYLPADLGEPKGEEVGVADLLSGFPVAH